VPPAADGRTTKAERRDSARRARQEALRRAAQRKRRRRVVLVALAGLAVVGGGIGAVVGLAGSGTKKPAALAPMLTSQAPWPVNSTQALRRAHRDHLPAAGTTLHVHAHLDLLIDGHGFAIPEGIGLAPNGTAPLHTHDQRGILHVESSRNRTFTLGEFFDVWGVRFSQTCIGAYCNTSSSTLQVYVNGVAVGGDPRTIALTRHEEIVIAYGTPGQTPNPVPKSYRFPSGL
jgi:hypothetical protein